MRVKPQAIFSLKPELMTIQAFAAAIGAQNQTPATPMPGPLHALPDLFPDSSV
jgi:hypothetical protein